MCIKLIQKIFFSRSVNINFILPVFFLHLLKIERPRDDPSWVRLTDALKSLVVSQDFFFRDSSVSVDVGAEAAEAVQQQQQQQQQQQPKQQRTFSPPSLASNCCAKEAKLFDVHAPVLMRETASWPPLHRLGRPYDVPLSGMTHAAQELRWRAVGVLSRFFNISLRGVENEGIGEEKVRGERLSESAEKGREEAPPDSIPLVLDDYLRQKREIEDDVILMESMPHSSQDVLSQLLPLLPDWLREGRSVVHFSELTQELLDKLDYLDYLLAVVTSLDSSIEQQQPEQHRRQLIGAKDESLFNSLGSKIDSLRYYVSEALQIHSLCLLRTHRHTPGTRLT